MTTTISDCGCGCGGGCGGGCLTLPAEFVRVRYYYGQRLGVMELSDQTAYHAGKLAFHNARLHGVGVVCGLRAERMPAPGGGASRVLRVHRGAALDGCGREVVVGVDQCIDVGAWFARVRGTPEVAGWGPGTTQTVRVALRYRECPSDPGPAPRDACGCDSGGCEYGRVREGFELALHVPGGEAKCLTASPAIGAFLDALGEGTGGTEPIDRRIATLVGADCPEVDDHDWLCLANVRVVLDAAGLPADIGAIDNAIPERLSLLPTAALQGAVLALAGSAADGGTLGSGPRAGPLAFQGTAPDAGVATLPITLAKTGNPPVDVPIEPATFKPIFINVQRLDAGTGWKDVTPPVAAIALTAAPPAITVTFAAGLVAGRPYRLVVNDSATVPIADVRGGALSSQPIVRPFALVLSGGNLTLDPAF